MDGKEYYKVSEVAVLAGVNARTLRRWIGNGDLDHFLFPYRQTVTAPLYYRLEPPDETDQFWDKEPVYQLRAQPKKEAGNVDAMEDDWDIDAALADINMHIDEHIERMTTNCE